MNEPEELRLWRRIAFQRDLYVKQITSWQDFRRNQRAGWRQPLDPLPDEKRRAIQQSRDDSERMIDDIIAAARDRLEFLDGEIERLRKNEARAYPLSKVERVANALEDFLSDAALDAVRAYIKTPADDHMRLMAKIALLRVREPDADDQELALRDTPDVDALLRPTAVEERRAEVRKIKNGSGSDVAREIVAAATGAKPHSRKLRR